MVFCISILSIVAVFVFVFVFIPVFAIVLEDVWRSTIVTKMTPDHARHASPQLTSSPPPSTPFVFPTIVYHTLGPFHTYSLYNSPIPIALSFATIVLNFTLEASNMCSELYTCPNSCTPSTQVLNCTFLFPFVFARLLSCSGPRLMWSMFLQFEPWSAHSKYQLTLSPWE